MLLALVRRFDADAEIGPAVDRVLLSVLGRRAGLDLGGIVPLLLPIPEGPKLALLGVPPRIAPWWRSQCGG